MSSDKLKQLTAACLLQPGADVILRMTLSAMKEPGAAPDVEALFGVLDPAAYTDAELMGEISLFLRDMGRPDLAHRWAQRAEALAPPAPHVAETNDKPATPWMPKIVADNDKVVNLQQVRPPEQRQAAPRERVGLDDVAGLADVKNQIRRRIIQPFTAKGLYAKFKRKAGGGVLMYGPPGCGKTMLARATATEVGATFMLVEISEILSRWLGESEKRMKQIFENARRQTPAILFFDEVEALARKRSFSENNVDSMVSVFLNEFDGLAGNNDGVLVLAATNVPWSVDPAFRRPGRFDRTIFVPPPDKEARLAILKGNLARVPHLPDIDLAQIVERTSGYSGADLAGLVDTAADYAIDESMQKDSVQPIGLGHLIQALGETRATTLEWLTTARNYAEYANRDGAWDDLAAFLRKHA